MGAEDDDLPPIGWVGGIYEGALLCKVPGCGWQLETNFVDAEDEADAHWATHRGPES